MVIFIENGIVESHMNVAKHNLGNGSEKNIFCILGEK